MKHKKLKTISSVLVLLASSAMMLALPTPTLAAPASIDGANQLLIKKPTINIPVGCPDPAAESLTFRVLSKDAKFPMSAGRILITGVVKNVGNAVFESDPRQANVTLYEIQAGGRGIVKAQQSISRLEPDATITLTYTTDWNKAIEFPVTYSLVISYDPDIYLDANKKNDDCNQNNNKKELPGTEINRLWPH